MRFSRGSLFDSVLLYLRRLNFVEISSLDKKLKTLMMENAMSQEVPMNLIHIICSKIITKSSRGMWVDAVTPNKKTTDQDQNNIHISKRSDIVCCRINFAFLEWFMFNTRLK